LKRIIRFFVAVVIVVFSIGFILNQAQYTSFTDLVPEKELSKIDRMIIDRYSDDVRVSITDKDVIRKIIGDFSKMKLKKVDRTVGGNGLYAVRPYPSDVFGIELIEGNYVWIKTKYKSGFFEIVNDEIPFRSIEEDLYWESRR